MSSFHDDSSFQTVSTWTHWRLQNFHAGRGGQRSGGKGMGCWGPKGFVCNYTVTSQLAHGYYLDGMFIGQVMVGVLWRFD